jgi:putative two-component system response regulator
MTDPDRPVPEIDRPPRVLVVEDQPEIQRLISSMLYVRQLPNQQAATVARAREIIARDRPEIIFLDINLTDGSGLSLIERAGPDDPLVVVITGAIDIETAVQALRKGAVDFIAKPFTVGDLFTRIDGVVAEWKARERLRAYGRSLEDLVRRTTEDIARTEQRIGNAHDAAVEALAAALSLKDHETDEHRRRVAEHATRLGRAHGLDEGALRALRWGAYLHDVGKIGVPERILARFGALEGDDLRIMEQHPAMGARILGAVPFLAEAAEAVRCHHERFDGTGYPSRLAGTATPLAARIIAIADALDEAIADRPEHRAVPFAAFAAEIAREAGRRFDPDLVKEFLELDPGGWVPRLTMETVSERR